MIVNWVHYTIPKVSFVLSFISNPLFIYLIYTNKNILFGSYRYLLAFFAIFNLLASVADLLVPVIDFHCLHSAPEMRDYIRVPFKELLNQDIDGINFVAGLFSETTPWIVERSWAGILSLTAIALYSITLYFVLGYKIVTGLNIKSITMSKQTAQMQKQLFKALAIQTIIPVCVSFIPCTLSFYGAALRWDFMNWVYWASAVALSMFPFLDPMAIIFFLPALRRRICVSIRKKKHEIGKS
ncbi:hypothetical protein CAEBREN_06673 [Caenorhabditis brenneri]|uniref:Serpentine Receptor, class J n=1 Tax=Caenorhabditis brenneri TaxID=135651 RepID=G0M912_CAEBE|nr:hypothetical protein CAEBREN_06673 [Caenorhabditis brenneri]